MKVRWLSLALVLLVLGSSCSLDPNTAKRKYLESGNKYFSRGKYREASIMYRSALKKDVRYAPAYYHLGLTFLKLKDPISAERALRRAFELLPSGSDRDDAAGKLADIYLAVYLSDTRRNKAYEAEVSDLAKRLPERSFDRLRLEGYMAMQNGDLDTALQKFGAANEVKPLDSALVLAYAQALAARGRFDEAEQLSLALVAKDRAYGPIYDFLYSAYLRRSRQAAEGAAQKELEAKAEQIWKRKTDNNPTVVEYRLQLASHYLLRNRPEESARVVEAIASDSKTFPGGLEKAGDFYLIFRQYEKAISYYKQGIQNDPKQKLTLQRKIADVLTTQGKQIEAIDYLEKQILKDNPKDATALAMRASLWLDSGNRAQLQAAASELEAAVTRLPQNAVVRFNLGRAYWARGDLDLAGKQFRTALDLQPDYLAPRLALAQISLVKGEFPMALQTANEALALSGNNLSARLIRAAALQGVGKSDDARADLQGVLKVAPSYYQARLQLGGLELSLKNYPAAEKAFADCNDSPGGDYPCLLGLAEVYAVQKNFAKAIDLIGSAQKNSPSSQKILLALANTYVMAGDYPSAVERYTRLISQDPNSADYELRLGETYRRAGKNDEAIQHFRRVKQLQPSNAEAAVWLALLLQQMGKQAEAKTEYERILKLQPDNPVALNNLAYLVAEQGGDLDVALTYAQRAKQKFPQSLDISDTLGWIMIKKNLTPSALDIYRDLVAKQPANSTYRYHMGMALFQQGDKSGAKRELQTALSQKPSREETAKIQELLQKIG